MAPRGRKPSPKRSPRRTITSRITRPVEEVFDETTEIGRGRISFTVIGGLFFLAAFAALIVFIVYAGMWASDIPTPEEINAVDGTILVDTAKALEIKTRAEYAFFASVLGMLVVITLVHTYHVYM